MKWSDLGLAKKLRLPIATVGILLLILSVLQITDMERISKEFSHINEEYIPGIELVLNADRDLYQAQIAERSIALGLTEERFFKMHEENIQQVEARLKKITNLNISKSIIADAKQFLVTFNEWRPKTEGLVKQVKDQRISIKEATQISTNDLDSAFEFMRDKLDLIGEQLGAQAAALQLHTVETKQQAMSKTFVLVLVAILITVCVAVFFPRMIIGPLNHLSQSLDELASGKGDLTKRMPRFGNDEIGRLSHSFNRFLSGMQSLMKRIQVVALEVNSASGQLQEGAQDSLTNSEHYARSMEMVSTANHEMGLAIQEVSTNTQQVSEEAKHSDQTAKQVSKDFHRAMQEIELLADNVMKSGLVIQEIVSETTNIASVLDVIKGIAEQTNLLALNAAIEAARAGEQGRGFAVVADEVRTLASKTQQSTGDINNMIENLRGGVNKAVESMKEGEERATSTVEYAKKSEENLSHISSSLVSISDRILQVASAIEEQTSVIDEINSNLNGVNELSKNAQENTKLIDTAVKGLNQQSKSLTDQVSNFVL
ncbi:MAG: methyl-accepting chemotaxis protein [Bermanella sp.]|mgnify:CR=1 FL=1